MTTGNAVVGPALEVSDVRRFVRRWFGWLDQGEPPGTFVQHLSQRGFEMVLPGKTLRSHEEFGAWLARLRQANTSIRHTIERTCITWDKESGFLVELDVRRNLIGLDGRASVSNYGEEWRLQGGPAGQVEIRRVLVTLLRSSS